MDISLLFALILWAQEDAQTKTGGGGIFSSPLIPMIGIFILAWFFLILPQQRRQKKEQEERMKSLKKNDKVVLQSGIIGIISSVKDDSNEVVLKLEEGKVRVLKTTIANVLNEKEEEKSKEEPKKEAATQENEKETAIKKV